MQQPIITGIVTEETTNSPLIGVTVVEKGTQNGAITDLDGKYSITVTDPEAILVFSFIGYESKEIPLNGRSNINIVLKEDITELDEIVVIGYGTVKKSDLTGAVASIKSDELTKITSSSPEQALQGKISGMRVTSNSGEPGSKPVIRIRGVGTYGNPDPIFIVDGVILDDITFLNSNDIQSIEVLKDASSTAMYGSRGANGVIIITTKSGMFSGKTMVDFSASYELQTIQKYIDMLDAREFAIAINKIQPGTFNNLNLLENTDWQQEVYKDYAPMQNYQLSLRGGGEKTTYYAGVGYYKQDGIIPKSGYERLTIKVNNEYRAFDFLKFGHNLTVSKFNQDKAANIVASTLRAWPTDSPYEEDGSFNGNRGNGNPLASIAYNNNTTDGIRGVGNFYGELKFLKYFTFRSSYGVDLQYSDDLGLTPIFFVTPQQQNDKITLTKTRKSKENWLWENTLNFQLEKGDHFIDAVAGYTAQEDNTEDVTVQAEDIIREDILYFPGDLTKLKSVKNEATIKSIVSYLFRVNYVYKDRYLLTSTFRRDGSSIFATDYRWGNFPSFAAGWRISEEPFFNKKVVSNLKLRASWGIIGNDKVKYDDRYTSVLGNAGAVFGTSETYNSGSTYDKIGNELIKWEEAIQTDVGTEVGFWNNKFTVELDYYRKLTRDILVELQLPGHIGNGSSSVRFNAGDVLNTGVEFNLSWRDNLGNFTYQVGVLGSTVHNEVTKLGEDTGAKNFILQGSLGNGQNVKRIVVGEPIGYFHGYKVVGVFQDEAELAQYPRLASQGVGDFIYEDVTDDGKITTDDMTNIGSPIPDFIFGFNTSFGYKGISLSLDFQGEYGNEIYDGKDAVRSGQYNYQAHIADAWDGPGTSNTQPQVTAAGVNYTQSDWFVHDGSFIRLRNITLGYTLPEQIVSRLKIQGATIYLKGTNVFTLTKYTGYTPEIGGEIKLNGIDTGIYPVTSVYGMGINLTF